MLQPLKLFSSETWAHMPPALQGALIVTAYTGTITLAQLVQKAWESRAKPPTTNGHTKNPNKTHPLVPLVESVVAEVIFRYAIQGLFQSIFRSGMPFFRSLPTREYPAVAIKCSLAATLLLIALREFVAKPQKILLPAAIMTGMTPILSRYFRLPPADIASILLPPFCAALKQNEENPTLFNTLLTIQDIAFGVLFSQNGLKASLGAQVTRALFAAAKHILSNRETA